MNRAACCALALCCLAAPVAAAPAAAEATIRLVWPGTLDVRCEVPLGTARLSLRCEAETEGQVQLVAGFDSPFVRVGALTATGLLREAGNPLGYGPGSVVAEEATGLCLRESMSPPTGWSVEVSLVPEAIALFWMNPRGGSGVLGCTLGPGRRGPMVLEAMAAVGDFEADGTEAAWIVDSPSAPAGRSMHGAMRIGVSLPEFFAVVSGGISAAERAPPGWFGLAAGAIGRGDAGIDFLAAGASRGYLALGGDALPGGAKAGVRFRLVGPLGSVRATYVMSLGLPGFVPGPFLPAEEVVALVMERGWPARRGAWEARLSLSNRITTGSDGTRGDDPFGALSVGWDATRVDAAASVEFDRDGGCAVEVATDVAGTGSRAGLGGDLRCSWPAGDPSSLSVTGHARYARGTGEVLLRAGVRGVRLAAGGFDGGEPWGSLELRVRDRSSQDAAGR